MSADRVVVFTGKGGAGTTTVAAATALAAAQRGGRALVASLAEPGALSRVLSLDGSRGLRRLEIQGGGEAWAWDPALAPADDPWSGGARPLGRLLDALGLAGLRPEEALALPGFRAAWSLGRVAELIASGDHDLVALDAGPAAEGLRSIGWLDLLSAAPDEDDGAATLPGVATLAGTLRDPSRGAGRLVMTGEPTALDAGLKTAARLSLLGIRLESVIVNRLFVPSVTAGYLGAWAGTQSRVLAQARDRFGDAPIWPCWLQPEEVVGVPALLRLADDLYAGRDPIAPSAAMEAAAAGPRGERNDTAPTEWEVPFVAFDELSAARRDDGVAIVAHGFRRVFSWPADAGRPARRARIQGGRLRLE